MKTNKEILKLMLNHIHLLESGLCGLVYIICRLQVITANEDIKALEYIKRNRPKTKSKLADPSRLNTHYYWELGKVEPRVRWLKYHIRICKS